MEVGLTFEGLCLVIYSYNKTNEKCKILEFIFGIEVYMFRALSLYIIRCLGLYTQHNLYVLLCIQS